MSSIASIKLFNSLASNDVKVTQPLRDFSTETLGIS